MAHISDDPYDRELLRTFLAVVLDKNQDAITSSYADAAKTYKFPWAIRLAGEMIEK
jgi:hypothetical protein